MGTKTIRPSNESPAHAKLRREAQAQVGQQLGVQPPQPRLQLPELDVASYRRLYLAVRDLLLKFRPHDCDLRLSLYSDMQFDEDFMPTLDLTTATELLPQLTTPWQLSQDQLNAALYHLQPELG